MKCPKALIPIFLTLFICMNTSLQAVAAETGFRTNADFSFRANANSESGAAADSEFGEGESGESETGETELVPVLLETDEVSTDEILLYSGAGLVMDVDSGRVLYYKNPFDKKYPASLTKIMTTLMALENSSLDEIVTVSQSALDSITWDSSQLGVLAGQTLTMEEALYAMMVASANEIANAVGEHIAGSTDAFVEMMNDYAKELGCFHTHFVNPNGLHDDNHYTSVYDMAMIARAALANEEFVKICSTDTYMMTSRILLPETSENGENAGTSRADDPMDTPESGDPFTTSDSGDFTGTSMPGDPTGESAGANGEPSTGEPYGFYNHHKMVNGTYPYEYAYGGKTGFTENARFTLATFAKKDRMHLICILFDAPDAGNNYIYKDTAALLDYCFDNYQRLYEDSSLSCYDPKAIRIFDFNESGLMESRFAPIPQDQNILISPRNHNTVTFLLYDRLCGRSLFHEDSLDQFFALYATELLAKTENVTTRQKIIGIFIAALCVLFLFLLLHFLILSLKRKRRRMRYHKLKKQRLTRDAAAQGQKTKQ